ncbi:MAG: hypothetical protein F3741_09155 [Nitrospinae bacterium]|nr:hypothetical protein [Nitrospinota bacterium]
MNDKKDPDDYLNFSRSQLRGDIKDLDADTREKLMQLRHRAMESTLEGTNRFPDWATLPIIAFISALLFILLVYFKPKLSTKIDEKPVDLEILLSSDSLEFYENLEFLQKWKDGSFANQKEDN